MASPSTQVLMHHGARNANALQGFDFKAIVPSITCYFNFIRASHGFAE
jgi:hypothetical protein